MWQMKNSIDVVWLVLTCNKIATNVIKKRKYTSIARGKFVNLKKKTYFCIAKNVNKQKNGYS